LYLGNLDACRDWGHARDYVEMQWLMLQQETPQDYVIATGRQYSVRYFVEQAARELGIMVAFLGEGLDEVGVVQDVLKEGLNVRRGDAIIGIDPRYFRPTEVDTLLGDASKAYRELGWEPKTSFEQLVAEMVAADFADARREQVLIGAGLEQVGGAAGYMPLSPSNR
jgi:GDPmannose 4,6-dehydratase